jgi:hypothetical protein
MDLGGTAQITDGHGLMLASRAGPAFSRGRERNGLSQTRGGSGRQPAGVTVLQPAGRQVAVDARAMSPARILTDVLGRAAKRRNRAFRGGGSWIGAVVLAYGEEVAAR